MPSLVSVFLAAAVLLPQAPPSPTPTAAAPTQPDYSAFHVVLLRLGPRWQKSLPVRQQPGMAEHGAYMSRLSGKGKIIVGGPFLEDRVAETVSGAMVIFATTDATQARRLMEEDPGVKSGLFEIAEVRRFVVATGSWRPWKQPPR